MVESSAIAKGADVQLKMSNDMKNKYLHHIEKELFAAAAGNFDEAHLLLAALLERTAVKVRNAAAIGFHY